MQENHRLQEKYENDPSFQAEMDKSFEEYQLLVQESYYSRLEDINEDLLIQLDGGPQEVYFYCAMHHHTNKKMLHKTALYFYKSFNRNPKKNYSIVFLNQEAESDAYSQFKEIFLQLPIDYFVKLNHFVMVKPSFFNKAQDFITFNVLPAYLKSRTHYVGNCRELCAFLKIKEQDLVDLVPEKIWRSELKNMKPRKLDLRDQRINYQGQIRDESELRSMNEFESTIKEFLFMKPGKETHVITDYEASKIGIPVVLEVLIFYFKTHPEGLRLEGLFRKSVSIDEENETLAELANQNYDCLLTITNAHIVANLIKRFFSNLRIPIFPYKQFEQLMHDQGIQDKRQHVKNVVASLPKANYNAILYLITFLKEDVITQQEKNKMTTQNISICFAPCLLRAEKASHADLIYASKCAMVTKLLLDDMEYIFGDKKQRNQVFRNSEKDKLESFKDELEKSVSIEKEHRLSQSNSPRDPTLPQDPTHPQDPIIYKPPSILSRNHQVQINFSNIDPNQFQSDPTRLANPNRRTTAPNMVQEGRKTNCLTKFREKTSSKSRDKRK